MSVCVQNLNFSYTKKRVLKGVDFCVDSGQLVCLLGPNGVGKSTLFRCILGLLRGYSGAAYIDGQDIGRLSPKQLARLVAYIPQSHAPAFNYSVLDMTLMGTTPQLSAFVTPGKREIDLAEAALARLDILHLRDRSFLHTSGGEQQLVLIARALAQQAKVLVMDEPTANLDYGNQIRVLDQVKALSKNGYTIIQSTHHPDQAFLYADVVLAMMDGKILAKGSPQQIINAGLIRDLYGVDVIVHSLFEDSVRVCIPRSVVS